MRWVLIGSILCVAAAASGSVNAAASAVSVCMSAMRTELDALKAQIRSIETEPDASSGVSAKSLVGGGRCRQMLIVMNASDGTVPPKEADKAERKACLEVELRKRENACRCLAAGQRPSVDDTTIKSAINARARFTSLRKQAEFFGIRDPAVRQFVNDASEVQDCWSTKSLQILEQTSDAIQALTMADRPPSVSPVYGAPPSVSTVNGGPPPVSPADGGTRYAPRPSASGSDISGTTPGTSSYSSSARAPSTYRRNDTAPRRSEPTYAPAPRYVPTPSYVPTTRYTPTPRSTPSPRSASPSPRTYKPSGISGLKR